MHIMSIVEDQFNGMPASEMYRAQYLPDVFPHQKPMLLENWSKQDLEMFVGGEYLKPAQNFRPILVIETKGDEL